MKDHQTNIDTFDGNPCRSCGGTERYRKNKRCVPCARAATLRSSRKSRASIPKAWDNDDARSNMPVPDKPNRRGWPRRVNVDGEPVYFDPIMVLGLGNAGKFV